MESEQKSTELLTNKENIKETEKSEFVIEKSEKFTFTKHDFIILGLIIVIYSVLVFVNLGAFYSPQTMWRTTENETVIVDLGEEYNILRIQYLFAEPNNGESEFEENLMIELSPDGINWGDKIESSIYDIYKWRNTAIQKNARYIRLTPSSPELFFGELIIVDLYDNIIPIQSVTGNGVYLFDEQEIVPFRPTALNNAYFDERHYTRSVYDYMNGFVVTEWTHPPLGKLFMLLSAEVFGMTPFGWRFPSALFGVLMLPFLYVFAKRMLKSTYYATFVTLLFACDFMHFVMSRIATLDSFTIFFIIAMYGSMYQYYTMSFYDTKLSKTFVPLFFSGLFMGLGIATKWIGIYGGIGLAIIFFMVLAQRYREYRYAKKHDITGQYHLFYRYTLKTCSFCVLVFVLMPLLIYILSHIPYYICSKSIYAELDTSPYLSGHPFLLKIFTSGEIGKFIVSTIFTQTNMFSFHSGLAEPHEAASHWWQWIYTAKPILFSYLYDAQNNVELIVAAGNPAVWIGGGLAIVCNSLKSLKKYSKNAIFLLIAYAAVLLPWVFVKRPVFIYHYFAAIPFLCLSLGYLFKNNKISSNKKYSVVFFGISALFFILCYPILAGSSVSAHYVENFLKPILFGLLQIDR